MSHLSGSRVTGPTGPNRPHQRGTVAKARSLASNAMTSKGATHEEAGLQRPDTHGQFEFATEWAMAGEVSSS